MAVVSAWAVGQSLSPEMAKKRAQTISNSKQVALGFLLYASDYDDMLPVAKSTGQAQKAVLPYLRSRENWKSENPGSKLLFNTNLSGLSMTVFPKPAQTPLLYETKAWSDGGKVIAYVDGHVKLEPKEELPAIEAMLKKKWLKGGAKK